ncbi:hypothetical protein [Alkalinema sp. FACHB-956]|uniref:hypothetical protein n=1 Tax=Alkalinema sp. FACHB-956 TaxID=2692768 RepID=UPI001684393B|nr:hypothetical protein [Alkalinema sp. FACHB-956]MBD2327754.1 hypothetical protein [Alkalinema sp. FACHB-956]
MLDTIALQPWQPVTIAEMEAIASPLPAPSRATAQLAQNPGNDPELGEIRLKPNTDPELGTLTLRPISASDPELGDLRIREPRPLPAPPPPKAPSVFLLGRVDYFRNTNIFSSAFLQESDGLIRSGLTLFYAPALGPQTYAVTSIDANVIRYANASLLNYDELRFRAGILQRLSPRMFGEIGWSNQQLFTAKEGLRNVLTGERFLNDNSLRIEFSRQDPLTRQLSFNTYYQFRWSLVDEIKDYDRLINTFISSLSYQLSPSLQAALDYQFIWTHFTQQSREDWYHQLAGRLSYTLNPRTQINIFGGRSFGNSSNPGLNFNGWLLGVGVVFNVPLF